MLASTVQFSSNNQPPNTHTGEAGAELGSALKDQPHGRALRTQQRAQYSPLAAHRFPRTEVQY